MRILHLSDTHVERTDAPNRHGVNPTESLRLMLDGLRHQRDVDAIVVTGDIANDGAVEAYATVRELLREFALPLDAPVFCTTGNHDEREAFGKVLGSGHLAADGSERAETVLRSAAGERAAVSTVAGWRFVTLDSLVPGKVHGWLSTEQLAWLRGVLATPAPRGTVLALHHPPISLDVGTQRVFGLRNPSALADAVRGTGVRVVLAGHFHLQLFGMLEAVPVWVTPGVVTRMDLTTRPGTERAVRGASASLIELGDGSTGPMFHTLHARDPRAHETVYEIDEEQTRALIQRFG
ncbi:metallophosphoesterase [Streptomyces spinosirectus]|uniref:metallophosphoesterase family protein n=1 Tax=Streptomyces TaxID=1883 RepID=UPI000D39DAE6|nr:MULTISPECIES: metallophosphoesterase [Streptomyces]MBY8339938.1 metallophosphoesterase [Streptomyces plumbidurans]PTM98172.1 3',5'-cyclic AMP phosphodiesterase CpdA [Streptomyces sp. VMFN-G11Ma]UIR19676.1 metallophosphoesterase [Streptomyces spinosirectus]